MPWRSATVEDARREFLIAYQNEEASFSALCRYFGITRPTGYKWLGRFARGEGLGDRSRAPHVQRFATPSWQQAEILALRARHPLWGPKKLLPVLQRRRPEVAWPAASTVGEILRREGLTHPRPRRRRTLPNEQPLSHAEQPNAVWCADFKGWFLTGDGRRCDPLTITDAYSRYLIRCRHVPKTDGPHVREVFTAAFREHGLPAAIRTDNGPPFASTGLAGLSRLAIWWLRLGIRPERIAPGEPQQNGRHERFHQTLKQATAAPPRANLRLQQGAFARFQQEYNRERPHEALGQRVPAEFYRPSARPFPDRLPHLAYRFACNLRHVSPAGHVSWIQRQIYVSVLLEGEDVALREVDCDMLEVHFGPLLLGWIDVPSATFTPIQPPPRRLSG